MIPIDYLNPAIVDRVTYWWERCLYRILQRGSHNPRKQSHAEKLRELVQAPASETRLGDLVYPST